MKRPWLWAIAGGLALLLVLGWIFVRPSIIPRSGEQKRVEGTDTLEEARETLRKSTDLAACRSALERVNAHLARNPAERVKIDPSLAAWLARDLKLDAKEQGELESDSFTLLDGHHLDCCFLLRDVARSLRKAIIPQALRDQEARAEPAVIGMIAFSWVCRHVRLDHQGSPEVNDRLPAEVTLRRGFGSPLGRALVFVRLLEQLSVSGCLLTYGSDEVRTVWGCGVLGQDGQIYVFDPRLGIPFPSASGLLPATLAELAGDKSGALERLTSGDRKHDLTPEKVRDSRVWLCPPLSALTPRMKVLEKTYLGPEMEVRLAADLLSQAERWTPALARSGLKKPDLTLSGWVCRLQRQYQTPGEGGVGDGNLQILARMPLMPLSRLVSLLPREVWAGGRPNLDDLQQDPLLNQLYNGVSQHMSALFFEPNQVRDRLLRGQFSDEAQWLLTEADRMQIQLEHFKANLSALAQLKDWHRDSLEARAVLLQNRNDPTARAQLEAVYRRYAKPLDVLFEGATAAPRLAQLAYMVAQWKHDQTELFAWQLDLAERATLLSPYIEVVIDPRDYETAQSKWDEAERAWSKFLEQVQKISPRDPTEIHELSVPSARLHQAFARQEKFELARYQLRRATEDNRKVLRERFETARQMALNAWIDLSRQQILGDFEKLTGAYYLRRLEALKE